MATIHFHKENKLVWLELIMRAKSHIPQSEGVLLDFSGLIEADIEPIHLVSLACLIEHLVNNGSIVRLQRGNDVGEFLWKKLRFKEYWAGRSNYAVATTDTMLNLGRVVDTEKEVYAFRVHDYLKNRFFKSKDLSAVKNSLDEVFYNIFDHAEANNNAFSFIQFDKETEKVRIAVCDFGMGIARSVQKAMPQLTDKEALEKAMEYQFTTKTQGHNKGVGLCNIRETCTEDDYMFIISNRALLMMNKTSQRSIDLPFCFDGTIIAYEVTLSHFEDEEIIENFTL